MTCLRNLIIALSVLSIQYATGQCTLTIKQRGSKSSVMDSLILYNYQDMKLQRLNDSTIQYTLNISKPESSPIMIDLETKWSQFVWLDPEIKNRELIIDYSKRTVVLSNPNSWDLFLQTIDALGFDSISSMKVDSLYIDYIQKNPHSFNSLWLLSMMTMAQSKPQGTLLKLFTTLDPALVKYPEYTKTKNALTKRRIPNIGDPFKEFTLADINDKKFNSTSLNNKYILLHFWSTGCGPCIREMDDMVNFYNSLDTSKIAFISVSLDDKQEHWKNSAVTKKIRWASVWQPDNFSGELCLNYNVNAMPFFIIFNKEKKISLITYGGDELELVKSTLRSLGK